MDEHKQAVAHRAAHQVEHGMIVGIGSGSTVELFIAELLHRCRRGLEIAMVPSSHRSAAQIEEGGFHPYPSDRVTQLDLTVDGADAIDPDQWMLKGGGGALLREKILAFSSERLLIIIDETKLVTSFEGASLPVELLPFATSLTLAQIDALGLEGQLRRSADRSLFTTDNHNLIYDIALSSDQGDGPPLRNRLVELSHALINIPGVVEVGLFPPLGQQVLIGKGMGEVEAWSL